jgi:hypothetical protein
MGEKAAHLRETDQSLMHRGHDLWLATLKWMSENSASRSRSKASPANANQTRREP